jgi:hypothetical protein
MSGLTTAEEVVILVKAVPQVGAKHGETVCCAGVTHDGQWRRMYPIKFRRLSEDAKFTRWDVVRFRASLPRDDPRRESRRIQEETIRINGSLHQKRRSDFAVRLVRTSTRAAAERGETLTLINPSTFAFKVKPMKAAHYEALLAAYDGAARQGSLFDKELRAFHPPKYHFFFVFSDQEGLQHTHQCGDWETIATFRKWSTQYGATGAIDRMQAQYESYFRKGMLLAMGTVRKRPQQWLLLGAIRVDAPTGQMDLI